ncbi:hypothetical protein BT96DRAFT_88323 [Gymnopus androsaceus JB14]|uniref:Uncharacterized protein n=1 Tax=Gymnopus androsaceus JB14 TaxID=1447944 RepID=A0A6A4GIK6_9AGAR|nr:hypothetical protein BT96DRAFT_605513 [Gymnopus androsaceus JB14]KAE9397036.1 hypothetical protein BT96DRAFT_88323 [Gymnopus androsaceus JB14]
MFHSCTFLYVTCIVIQPICKRQGSYQHYATLRELHCLRRLATAVYRSSRSTRSRNCFPDASVQPSHKLVHPIRLILRLLNTLVKQ